MRVPFNCQPLFAFLLYLFGLSHPLARNALPLAPPSLFLRSFSFYSHRLHRVRCFVGIRVVRGIDGRKCGSELARINEVHRDKMELDT